MRMSSSNRPSSRTVPETMLAPLNTPPVPVFAIPKSKAAKESLRAWTFRLPLPPDVSRKSMPVPSALISAKRWSSARLRRIKMSWTVVESAKSISIRVPSVRITTKSLLASVTAVPSNHSARPRPRMPRSFAARELLNAVISMAPPSLGLESAMNRQLPCWERDAVMRPLGPADTMACNNSATVMVELISTLNETPSESVT